MDCNVLDVAAAASVSPVVSFSLPPAGVADRRDRWEKEQARAERGRLDSNTDAATCIVFICSCCSTSSVYMLKIKRSSKDTIVQMQAQRRISKDSRERNPIEARHRTKSREMTDGMGR